MLEQKKLKFCLDSNAGFQRLIIKCLKYIFYFQNFNNLKKNKKFKNNVCGKEKDMYICPR